MFGVLVCVCAVVCVCCAIWCEPIVLWIPFHYSLGFVYAAFITRSGGCVLCCGRGLFCIAVRGLCLHLLPSCLACFGGV